MIPISTASIKKNRLKYNRLTEATIFWDEKGAFINREVPVQS